jgi:photosystem II stability/assembly factor-like uncharacterized protein
MRTLLVFGAACLGIVAIVWGQGRGGSQPATPPVNQSTDPLLRGFEFRPIGPATMGGRVDDIEGSEKDPMIVYVGFATGGLWKSTDGGNHWRSQFDNLANESIGDIAIAPSDPNVVYVGTGEANNRQSSTIGNGVWGTTDGGQHWNHLGLEETQTIARVVVDPVNPEIVYVAALGHLFGPNPERGVYKSIDGGKNWKQVKYIDPDTGFTDLAIDPSNPKILYAASFQRRRTWWGYNGGGPGSGLWKSIDAGETWSKLAGPGWPKAKDGIYGRIAISIFKAKPTILYAQVEAGASAGTGGGTTAEGGPARGGRGAAPPESANETGGAAPGAPGRGGRGTAPPDPNASGVFRSDDGGMTWTFMSNQNQRPTYFSQIRVDPVNDRKVFVGGNPGQVSLDSGKTWRPLTASHTDYHAFWINPKDPRVVAVGHDGGFDISNDGGITWDYHNDMAVGQFYQVSADMRRPYYVCGGLQDNNAWCGPSALRSATGPVNTDWFTVAGGDGFYTRQDPTDWAIVYAESQNGNMTRHDLRNGTQKNIRPNAGRGSGTAPAPPPGGSTPETPASGRGPETTVTGRRGAAPETASGGRGAAAPETAGGGRGGFAAPPNVINAPPNVDAFRFYWNAPIEISHRNPAVVYMAAQYFFKSTNRGDSWWMNPVDLTKNVNRWSPDMPIMGIAGDKPMAEKHDGYAASSLATQIRESPSNPSVLWIGTDDGNLQVTRDAGQTFTNVYKNIGGAPQGYVQISRIEPSHFDPGTAYVALDNHRNDDWKPYLFKTADYGKSWSNVAGNLPVKGPINALREDYDNPNLLFVGTEFGLSVSLNAGKEWSKFMTNLPSVRIDDLLIHPRDRDLIVATHGRSIWVADDITPLEQIKPFGSPDLVLLEPRAAVLWKNDPQAMRRATNRDFVGQNPQGGTAISAWSKSDLGPGKIEFLQNNQVVSTMTVAIQSGMNRFQWNMRGPAPAGRAFGEGRGGRGGTGGGTQAAPNAPAGAESTGDAPGGRGGRGGGRVPFVSGGGRGGGGGNLVEPGVYTIRLTAGSHTAVSSVNVLEDIWMRPQ